MKISIDKILNIFCKSKCKDYETKDCSTICKAYHNFKTTLGPVIEKLEFIKTNHIIKIAPFLEKNGWTKDADINGDYYSFIHPYNYGIDVNKENGEIVVIADSGDIFHIELTHESIYILVGFLITHPCNGLSFNYIL